MIIDLREKYTSNQLECNMAFFCNDNLELQYFSWNDVEYTISSYREKKDGVYIHYFNDMYILPNCLTWYRTKN